jgi:hypothetical protein
MQLTLKEIEDTFLHSEKDKKMSGAAWALLYFAARHEGIDTLDALKTIRKSPGDVALFIEKILMPGDIDQVKMVIEQLEKEGGRHSIDAELAKRMLLAWRTQQIMLDIAHNAAAKAAGTDED